MAVVITTSPDITSLDFSAVFDISQVTPVITATNQSVGPHLNLCTWWFVVTDPTNYSFHQGSATTPDETGNWTTFVVPEAWPQPFNQINWSGANYIISLYVKDSNGSIFSETFQFPICRPDGSVAGTTNNFGKSDVQATARCESAELYVEDKTLYIYQSLTPANFTYQRYTLVYPGTDDDNIPDPFVLNSQSTALLPLIGNGEGYVLYYDTIANYDINDNITVRVKYKFKKLFSVQCGVNIAPLLCEISRLYQQLDSVNCLQNQDPELRDKLLKINFLLMQAITGMMQPFDGIDVPAIIDEIKRIGGFTCDCTFKGVNGSNAASGITQSVVSTCGDIKATVTPVGTNFQWTFEDKTYVVATAPDIPTTAFTISPSVDSPHCTKTYYLNVNLDQLKTDLGIGEGCCPVTVPIKIHGSSPLTSPTSCPLSYFPANVWNADNTAIIGIARSSSDMVAIMNADSTWNTLGTIIDEGNCQVGILLNANQDAPPYAYVDLNVISPSCTNNTKTYDTPLASYCDPAVSLTSLVFPARIYVQYTSGGQIYPLGLINSYTAMITALGAEGSKPANITYSAAPTGPTSGHVFVQVYDANCTFNNSITILADALSVIATGANNNLIAQPFAGIQVYDLKSDAYVGQYPGTISTSAKPWHIKQSPFNANHLYYIETDTGTLYKYDITNPLFPIKLFSKVIPPVVTGAPPNAAFSGLPKYNGTVFSHWDVYLGPTEPWGQTDGANMYIMESVSGCIWKYDCSSDTIVASFYDISLVGKCPRTIAFPTSGTYVQKPLLYFSWDGNREDSTGLASGVDPRAILFIDLTATFDGSGIHTTIVGTNPPDRPWAISQDANGQYLWITTLNGGLILYNIASDSVTTTFSGIYGINFNGSTLVNSVMYFNGASTIIYASSDVFGTYMVDISNTAVPVALGAFDANTDGSLKHRNFLPIQGNCYGLLTYDYTDDGAIAKYDYFGNFIERISISPAGSIYNLITFSYVNLNPNGLV